MPEDQPEQVEEEEDEDMDEEYTPEMAQELMRRGLITSSFLRLPQNLCLSPAMELPVPVELSQEHLRTHAVTCSLLLKHL